MSNHEEDLEMEDARIVLTDEDGKEHEFELLTILEVDENNYAVLLPLLKSEDGENFEYEDEAIILKISQDEDDNDILLEIEDDEEWEKVASEYDRLASEE